MGTNPSYFLSGADGDEVQNRRPVERVNWYAAIAFCNNLSLAEGKDPVYSVSGVNWNTLTYSEIPTTHISTWDAATMDPAKNGYRLPTEMEWIWAAMGADRTSQPNTAGYGKAFAGSTGSNSIGDYAWYGGGGNSNSKTHEVGKKAANELGLKDMSGTGWEWCWDWSDSYPSGEQTDYAGSDSGTSRVNRVGSWGSNASYCTVADRYYYNPYYGDDSLGFRVVCP
jgi:formylglycine-generating enzyme required for sulfatase activity